MRRSRRRSGSDGQWDWGGLDGAAHDGRPERPAQRRVGEVVANDDYERRSATVSAAGATTPGAAVHGSVRYATDERGFPGPFGTNPIGVFAGIDTVSRGTNDRWLMSIAATLPWPPRRLQAQVAQGRIDGTYRAPRSSARRIHPSPARSTSRRRTARVQSDVVVSPRVDLSAGLELLGERAGSTYITGSAVRMIPVRRRVAAYFGEARGNWRDRLFVTGGVRVDDIRARRSKRIPTRSRHARDFPDDSVVSANPKIAAAWFGLGVRATSPSCAPRPAPASVRPMGSRSRSPTTRR